MQLPESWGILANLTHLDLAGNNFHGPIPVSWQILRALQYLDISQSLLGSNSSMAGTFRPPITNELPHEWFGAGAPFGAGMVSLQVLRCIQCGLKGNLSWLGDASLMPNIKEVTLRRNALTGPLPSGNQDLWRTLHAL
jgi:hypothetical protein